MEPRLATFVKSQQQLQGETMYKKGEEVHVTPTEARAGTTPNIMRYVLAASLVLVIVGFAVTLLVQG